MSNGAADKSMGVSKQYVRSPNILIVELEPATSASDLFLSSKL